MMPSQYANCYWSFLVITSNSCEGVRAARLWVTARLKYSCRNTWASAEPTEILPKHHLWWLPEKKRPWHLRWNKLCYLPNSIHSICPALPALSAIKVFADLPQEFVSPVSWSVIRLGTGGLSHFSSASPLWVAIEHWLAIQTSPLGKYPFYLCPFKNWGSLSFYCELLRVFFKVCSFPSLNDVGIWFAKISFRIFACLFIRLLILIFFLRMPSSGFGLW